MFGYVTICEPELKVKDLRSYKAYYCGLCRTLKERYGALGQMTLTYDMTFAVILLHSLYEEPVTVSSHRCKTHPLKKQQMFQSEITEYAADMNLILTWYHLKDDWQDEKSLKARLGMLLLHRKTARAIRRYPRQSRVIRRELKRLAFYEEKGSGNIDEPAGCFGRLMGELFLYRRDEWEKTLREIGFSLGKFIYIMDAYEDLEKDCQNGSYNPLLQMEKGEDLEKKCRDMLCMMIAEAAAAFERLPCLQDADILRNIFYIGVWKRYNRIQEKKAEAAKEDEDSAAKKDGGCCERGRRLLRKMTKNAAKEDEKRCERR